VSAPSAGSSCHQDQHSPEADSPVPLSSTQEEDRASDPTQEAVPPAAPQATDSEEGSSTDLSPGQQNTPGLASNEKVLKVQRGSASQWLELLTQVLRSRKVEQKVSGSSAYTQNKKRNAKGLKLPKGAIVDKKVA
jgi:hypothetical protein